ncbi:MAG: efflux RND transporter periplasmic adaptor subunit [Caldimonas sp.]|uniref:efflux RND transporter periplasmic adaptor subunit n=1 Tax=Caldimonas sp. TaxID=2838790 RepID=UPI00391CE2D8
MKLRCLAVFLSCLGALLWIGAAQAQAPSANGGAASVQVRPFGDVAVRPQREAPAAVVPRNQARVAAEVAGTLLRWRVDAGASVRRGELLAEIDPTDFRLERDRAQAAVQATQARLALAQTQWQRTRELVAQNFLSQEALNQRETELKLLQAELAAHRAQLATAERALARTRIAAPFAATVSQRLAQAGEYVAPGTVLYVLTETGAAEVSAQLAPQDVASLRSASDPRFEAGGRRTVALKLLRVAGAVTAPARTVEVRLAPLQAVLPGTEGRLLWTEDRAHVPPALIVRRDRRLGVFTVVQGKARFVPLPAAQEGRAAVAALPPDALVVVSGQAALQDGARVSIDR